MYKAINLRRINNALLAVIILINAYVILAPFAPAVIFWWQKDYTNRTTQLKQLLQPAKVETKASASTLATPKGNALVVPAMMLDTPILEGTVRNEYTTLAQGVWRWPSGSTPAQGGNTILIGHRFTYTDPRGIFYELNQVVVGDSIGVFWEGKDYNYTVSSVGVVPPSQTSILSQTSQSELTLYTCTPTWNPKYRLVVVAQLMSVRNVGPS